MTLADPATVGFRGGGTNGNNKTWDEMALSVSIFGQLDHART